MKKEILFFEKECKKLREAFSTESSLESLAFAFAERSSSSYHNRLIVKDLMIAGPKDYRKRSPYIVSPTKDFMTKIYLKCLAEQRDLIKIHSHVNSISPCFSFIDDGNDLEKLFPYLMRTFKGLTAVSIVTNTDFTKLDARICSSNCKGVQPVDIIKVLSSEQMHMIIPASSPLKNTTFDADVYSRTILAFGEKAQKIYNNLTVAVVGVGGLGAVICKLLARLPVSTLIIVDPDIVEFSNMNRLPGTTRFDALNHTPKVNCLKRYLWNVNPDLNVIAIQSDISQPEAQETVKQADILFGSVDRIGPRLIMNRLAIAHGIPYFDCGSGIQVKNNKTEYISGQIFKIIPGAEYCLSCMGSFSSWDAVTDLLQEKRREALSQAGYVHGADIPRPAVYFLNMNVASLAVWMMMRFCSSIGCQPVKIYTELKDWKLDAVEIDQSDENMECPICSQDGLLGLGNAAPLMSKIKEKIPDIDGVDRSDNGHTRSNSCKS